MLLLVVTRWLAGWLAKQSHLLTSTHVQWSSWDRFSVLQSTRPAAYHTHLNARAHKSTDSRHWRSPPRDLPTSYELSWIPTDTRRPECGAANGTASCSTGVDDSVWTDMNTMCILSQASSCGLFMYSTEWEIRWMGLDFSLGQLSCRASHCPHHSCVWVTLRWTDLAVVVYGVHYIIMFLSPPKLWALERASQPCLIAPKVRSVGVLATLLCTNTSSWMLTMIMLFSSTQVHGHGSHNTSRPLHFVDM